jgi:hypothetical protein
MEFLKELKFWKKRNYVSTKTKILTVKLGHVIWLLCELHIHTAVVNITCSQEM